MTYYRYEFADGYISISTAMSRNELAWEQVRHGKLVAQDYYGQ